MELVEEIKSSLIFKVALVFFFILFLAVCVNAKNTIASSESGFEIEYPAYQNTKIGQAYNYSFHVFNVSNGVLINGASCIFELYNSDGTLITMPTPLTIGDYYNIFIDAGNFTNMGKGGYVVHCNESLIGGYVAGDFVVTGTGESFTIEMSIFYVGVMAILAFFFVVNIFIIKLLPSHKNYNMDGRLMSVNSLAHLKIVFFGIGWGILLMISFLAWNIAEAYLVSELVVMTFRIIFSMLMWSAMVGFPVMGCYYLYKMIADSELKRHMERGLI